MGRPPGQDFGRPRRAVVSKHDGCYWARVPDVTRSRGGGAPAPGATRPALLGEAVGWPEVAPSPPGSDSAGFAPSAPSPHARVGLHRTLAGGRREGQSRKGGHLQPPGRAGTASPLLQCLGGLTPGGPQASDTSWPLLTGGAARPRRLWLLLPQRQQRRCGQGGLSGSPGHRHGEWGPAPAFLFV